MIQTDGVDQPDLCLVQSIFLNNSNGSGPDEIRRQPPSSPASLAAGCRSAQCRRPAATKWPGRSQAPTEYTPWTTRRARQLQRTVTFGRNAGAKAHPLIISPLLVRKIGNGDGVIGPLIPVGATFEIVSAYAGPVTFAGSTGTLQLDEPSSFAGTVAGLTGQGTLDLRFINPATVQTPTYSGNTSGRHTHGHGRHSHRQHRLAWQLPGLKLCHLKRWPWRNRGRRSGAGFFQLTVSALSVPTCMIG